MMDIEEIMDCADDISKNYDELIEMTGYYNLLGEGTHTVNGKKVTVDLYEIKKSLYKTLMSVNILEGVRFYVSFACSWAFAELKKMEGNAKIIKLIARDENLHLGSTQTLLKLLPKDDPDFVQIAKETEEECIKMFVDAVEQEKAWAEYLFKDGSMIGLNVQLLSDYIEWICCKRMTAVGLKCPYTTPQANPTFGQKNGSQAQRFKLRRKRQRFHLMLLVALSKMLIKTHSEDYHYNGTRI